MGNVETVNRGHGLEHAEHFHVRPVKLGPARVNNPVEARNIGNAGRLQRTQPLNLSIVVLEVPGEHVVPVEAGGYFLALLHLQQVHPRIVHKLGKLGVVLLPVALSLLESLRPRCACVALLPLHFNRRFVGLVHKLAGLRLQFIRPAPQVERVVHGVGVVHLPQVTNERTNLVRLGL